MSLLNGLVRYYKLDGNGNAEVGTNATVSNVTYASGKKEQAAVFNGSTSRVNIGLPINATTSSISLWVNVSNVLLSKRIISDAGGYWYIETTNTVGSEVRFELRTSGAIIRRVSHSLSTSTWVHLVATWDASSTKFYKNGVSGGAALGGPLENNTFNTFIGSANTNATCITGSLDEVGIWDRALTQNEVLQLYNGGNGLSYPFRLSNFFLFMP